MKLFYFGSVCSHEVFDCTVNESKIKPSASAQNFESALIKGFSNIKDLDVFSVSAESIATYPNGNRLLLKKRVDKISKNVYTKIVPAINLPFLKQLCHSKGTKNLLKKWLKENRAVDDKCILSYGIYPSIAKIIQKLCKKSNCKCFSVVTDVPSTMFTYTKSKNLLKRLFGRKYKHSAMKLASRFDGYVYLTEQMSDIVAPGKPYVVVETIADTSIFNSFTETEKKNPPVIMYAGSLHKKFGIDLIINTFKEVKSDCELWLFGSGDYEDVILEETYKNNRIKFFGRVDRATVLEAEKRASLLLNLRDSTDGYTKYSFPSKMVEYMLSGTPLLTTPLAGIPKEYNSFVYYVDSKEAQNIAFLIDEILQNKEQLYQLGYKGKKFVEKNKNCFVQSKKIYDFLLGNI